MALPFTITREDLLRSKTVTPGWYPTKVTKAEQAEAKTDGSTNTNIEVTITAEGPFKNVTINRTFSEKAPGFAIPYIQAVTGKRISEEGGQFDFQQTVGREILTYVKNEQYQGRLVNRAEDFKPIS